MHTECRQKPQTPILRLLVKIDQSNAALLTVSLPELKPGKYKVVWHVV
jgi:methionine-rich copper-binding protein CopC